MAAKICLQWNDFQENLKWAFGNLRQDNDFADVTLACEDGQQVEAHKVILAASSPFFQRLLVRNKQAHPIIYMRGLKSDDILAIVDFLYRGEANVCQANLNSFLAIADELQLNGLVQKTDQNFDQKYELPKNISQDRNPNIPNKIYGNQTPSREHGSDGTVVVQSPGNLKELDERERRNPLCENGWRV